MQEKVENSSFLSPEKNPNRSLLNTVLLLLTARASATSPGNEKALRRLRHSITFSVC